MNRTVPWITHCRHRPHKPQKCRVLDSFRSQVRGGQASCLRTPNRTKAKIRQGETHHAEPDCCCRPRFFHRFPSFERWDSKKFQPALGATRLLVNVIFRRLPACSSMIIGDVWYIRVCYNLQGCGQSRNPKSPCPIPPFPNDRGIENLKISAWEGWLQRSDFCMYISDFSFFSRFGRQPLRYLHSLKTATYQAAWSFDTLAF